MSTVLAYDRKAGYVRGSVADVNHVPKGDRANGFRHVVIDVLVH